MTDSLRTHFQQEIRIPEVHGERCVHAYIEQASCQACVDACPKQAWHLTDESLGIDVESCDGCGLCVPVCSEGAILHHHGLLPRQFKQHIFALGACNKTQLTGAGVIPCIHALSLRDLLQLYRQNIRGLIVSTGHCDECVRAPKHRLQMTIESLNIALQQREKAPLLLRELSPELWQQQYDRTVDVFTQGAMDRRNFLRRGLQTTVEQGLKIIAPEAERFVPVASLLPKTSTPANLPYVPQIDPTRCDGCDACLNICPHQALLFARETQYYVIEAEQCTGCRICVDICVKQAINITQWIIPEIIHIPLHESRCRRCGAPFHRPSVYQADKSLCHICTQVNHHRNLFQVLD